MKKIIFIFFIISLISFSYLRYNSNFMSTFKEQYKVKKNVEFYKDRMNKIDKLRKIAITEEEINTLDKRYVQAQAEIKLGEMTINKISGFMANSIVYPLMDAWIDIYDVTDKEDIISRYIIVRSLLLLLLLLITFIIIMTFIFRRI